MGKAAFDVVGGNAGGNIPSDLAELMQMWSSLPTETRVACMLLARGSISR